MKSTNSCAHLNERKRTYKTQIVCFEQQIHQQTRASRTLNSHEHNWHLQFEINLCINMSLSHSICTLHFNLNLKLYRLSHDNNTHTIVRPLVQKMLFDTPKLFFSQKFQIFMKTDEHTLSQMNKKITTPPRNNVNTE